MLLWRKRKSTGLHVRTYLSTCVCLSGYISICQCTCLSVSTLIYYIYTSPSFLFLVLFMHLFIYYSADTLLIHFKSNGFVRCLVVFTLMRFSKIGEILQIHSRHNHPRTRFGSGALNFWRAHALNNRMYRRHSHMTFIVTKTNHIIWPTGLATLSGEIIPHH